MSGAPAFEPWTIETVQLMGHKSIRVGILGLTTPGSAIWDRGKVGEVLDFAGGVETAEVEVPKLLAAGADVVIVLAHTGGSSYGAAIPYPENFRQLAEQVPGIDAIFTAHLRRSSTAVWVH